MGLQQYSQEEIRVYDPPGGKGVYSFFMVDSSSNNPKVIISGGCVKFQPVAFKKKKDGRQNSMKSVFSL